MALACRKNEGTGTLLGVPGGPGTAVLRHHATVPPSRQGQHSPTAHSPTACRTRGQPAPRPLPLSHLEAIKIIECFKYSALGLNIHQRSYSDCYTTSARAGKQFLSIKLPRPCLHSTAHTALTRAHTGMHTRVHTCAHVCAGMPACSSAQTYPWASACRRKLANCRSSRVQARGWSVPRTG